jgi:pimeloyl-ACP methyl ester carboxylesterase
MAATAMLAACSGDAPVPTASEFVRVTPERASKDLAIVFVHGIFGSAVGTWTHANGTKFFDLVDSARGVGGKADMFAFGYPSQMFRSGSFDIREAANILNEHVGANLQPYKRIVFVAHSMGGLVVLRELLTNADVRSRVPVLVFLGTPQEGADITRIAKYVVDNPAVTQMSPAQGNDLLQTLSDEWNSIPAARRPRIRCAYEKLETSGILIVPWSSATRFCDGAPPAIPANHIDMVKAHPDAVLVVTRALQEYVLNPALEPRLETPDFLRQGDAFVFNLPSAIGRQPARLINAGGGSLTFTPEQSSDPLLFLWPLTATEIPAGREGHLFMALGIGARATEYQFVLRTSVAPDTRVLVRVRDLPQAVAQQERLVQEVAGGIQGLLADPVQGPRLRAAGLTDNEAPAMMVKAAQESVGRMNPDLPDSARWVLAAEALQAINWPGLSVAALREAEKTAPEAARTPGVQRLAAAAGALSGESRVLQQASTPTLSPAEVERLGDRNLLVSANLDRARTLAGALSGVPSLRVFGLSLEGDVQKASGNNELAIRSYEAAAAIRRTPSVNRRLAGSKAALLKRSVAPIRGDLRPDSRVVNP